MLSVFQNRMMRKIFGPKQEENTGKWRKYCKESFKYVEIKCQLDATEVFIADLIACSTCFGHHYAHHQELKSIIQWLLPVWHSGARNMLSKQ